MQRPTHLLLLSLSFLSGHSMLARSTADVGDCANEGPIPIAAAKEDQISEHDENTKELLDLAFQNHLTDDQIKRIETLVQSGANVNAVDRFGASPLHGAAFNGLTGMVKILISHGANVDIQTKMEYCHSVTPLHLAADMGHLATCALLLKANADVNGLVSSGPTPLLGAAELERTDICILLIEHGASLDSKTLTFPVVQKALEVVNKKAQEKSKLNAELFDLVANQKTLHKYQLKRIKHLLAKGANVNYTDIHDLKTAMHHIVINGHSEVLGMLIECGAHINTLDDEGKSPLDYAALDTPFYELLVTQGAKHGTEIKASNI